MVASTSASSIGEHQGDRERGHNGTLSLLVAVPLTRTRTTQEELTTAYPGTSLPIQTQEAVWDPGLFHLAAAQLAVEHFNARNASVVRELSSSELQTCGIKLDKVVAVDTGSDAARFVVDQLLWQNSTTTTSNKQEVFDAIAGPYTVVPALQLGVLATALTSPLVAHRAVPNTARDNNGLLTKLSYFNHVGAQLEAEMNFVATYLKHIGRDQYVAILYNRAVLPKVEVLRQLLEQQGQVKTFGFERPNNHSSTTTSHEDEDEDSAILTALQSVYKSGYRTIVLLPEDSELDSRAIGPAATRAGLDKGQHVWIVSEGNEHRNAKKVLGFLNIAESIYGAKFLAGAAFAVPYDGYELGQSKLDFRAYLRRQDRAFYQRVLDLMPPDVRRIAMNDRNDTLLQLAAESPAPLDTLVIAMQSWLPGASFMYDSVMSIGMGACQSLRNNPSNSTIMTGQQHLNGIRSVNFTGASGVIQFGNDGSRFGELVPFVVTNLVKRSWIRHENGTTTTHTINTTSDDDGLVVRASESYVDGGKWIIHSFPTFYYADGSTSPPLLQRTVPNQNYISTVFRILGMILFGVALGTVLVSTLWLWIHRNHSVVIAGQPKLLVTICFASLLMSFTILVGAFDESWGFSQEGLDAACQSYVWLVSLGRTIAYAALFTKLYRVNCLLRYKTSNIATWRILWPFVIVTLVVLMFLTIWQVKSDYGWTRIIVDEVSEESVGACMGNYEYSDSLLIPIFVIQIVMTLVTGIMAFKALGIDDLYAESKWVLALVLVQMQVLIVAWPVIAVLKDGDPSARYIALCLLMFSFPTTMMGLIILPKALLVRKMSIRAAEKPPGADASQSQEIEETRQDADDDAADNSPLPVRSPSTRGSTNSRSSNYAPRIQMVTFD